MMDVSAELVALRQEKAAITLELEKLKTEKLETQRLLELETAKRVELEERVRMLEEHSPATRTAEFSTSETAEGTHEKDSKRNKNGAIISGDNPPDSHARTIKTRSSRNKFGENSVASSSKVRLDDKVSSTAPKIAIVGEDGGTQKLSTAGKIFLKADPQSILRYLEGVKPYQLSKSPLSITVSRPALAKKFNFSSFKLYDGRQLALFPTLDQNPYIPRIPGEPGLLLCSRKELCVKGPWKLFIDSKVDGRSRWNYIGNYRCKMVGSLTAAEFHVLSEPAKKGLAENIAVKVTIPEFVTMRARIILRHIHKREPTDEEIESEATIITNQGGSYQGALQGKDMVDAVIAAFEKGDESIGIMRLECTSYTHKLARDYAAAEAEFQALVDAEEVPSNCRQQKKRKSFPESEVQPLQPTKRLRVYESPEVPLSPRKNTVIAVVSPRRSLRKRAAASSNAREAASKATSATPGHADTRRSRREKKKTFKVVAAARSNKE